MPRVAIYARTSTDKHQTVENQLHQLNEVAARLGWTIVQVYTDEGISGTKGRDRRPAFDNLMKGVTRREFDLIAVWSVCLQIAKDENASFRIDYKLSRRTSIGEIVQSCVDHLPKIVDHLLFGANFAINGDVD